MTALAIVFAALAAIIHIYIFTLESLTWETPRTMKTFGLTTKEEVKVTKSLAYNQGFYNLFLAVGALIGIVVLFTGQLGVAQAIVITSCGIMALAGLILILSSPKMAKAALIQLVPPALAIIFISMVSA